jgi:hypothetical protein
MWEPRRVTTLLAFMACYRDTFSFFYVATVPRLKKWYFCELHVKKNEPQNPCLEIAVKLCGNFPRILSDCRVSVPGMSSSSGMLRRNTRAIGQCLWCSQGYSRVVSQAQGQQTIAVHPVARPKVQALFFRLQTSPLSWLVSMCVPCRQTSRVLSSSLMTATEVIWFRHSNCHGY